MSQLQSKLNSQFHKRFSEYSFSKHLRTSNKSSDEFEFMLNQLSLEEIIALKLELCSKSMNGKLYGFNLWYNFPRIAKEALLLFAVSATTNLIEAQTILGVKDPVVFKKILHRHRESLKHYRVIDLPKRNYLNTVRRYFNNNKDAEDND